MRKSTTLFVTVIAVLLLVLCSATGSIGLAGSAKDVTTRVFKADGRPLGSVRRISEDKYGVAWGIGPGHCSEEYSIFKAGGGRTFGADIGHTRIGAGVRLSTRKFNVWATPAYQDFTSLPPLHGHRLRGSIVWHSSIRWDLFSRTSRFIGYTIGRDGPAAGVAEMLFGGNLDDCRT